MTLRIQNKLQNNRSKIYKCISMIDEGEFSGKGNSLEESKVNLLKIKSIPFHNNVFSRKLLAVESMSTSNCSSI